MRLGCFGKSALLRYKAHLRDQFLPKPNDQPRASNFKFVKYDFADYSGDMLESDGPKVKRFRPSLVCENCRRKKIKCDKLQPCWPCTKAKMGHSCTYSSNGHTTASESQVNLPYQNSAKKPLTFVKAKDGSKKSPKNATPDDTVTISVAEFEMLKNRLSQIEFAIINPTALENKPDSSKLNPRLQDNWQTDFGNRNITEASGHQPTPDYNIPDSSRSNVSSVSSVGQSIPSIQPNVYNPINQSFSSVGQPYFNTVPPQTPSSQRIKSNSPLPSASSFGQPYSTISSVDNPSTIQLPPLKFERSVSYNNTPNYPYYSKPAYEIQRESLLYNKDSNDSLISKNLSTTESNGLIGYSDKFKALIGVNPYGNEDEVISFHDGSNSLFVQDESSVNFGPFSWAALLKRDKTLSFLWDVVSEKKGRNEIYSTKPFESSNSSDKQDSPSEARFQKKVSADVENGDLKPYIKRDRKANNLSKEDALRSGINFYDGEIDREMQLFEKVRMILPTKKVIWKLIKQFFFYVYAFTPFVDEQAFKETISRVIGPESEEEVLISEFNVENRLDLAHLGILLIVLRLAYISYFSNDYNTNHYNLTNFDPSPEARELKYLLTHPININVIDVARDCFQQFQIMKRVSFPVLQLAFFIKSYSFFAPEEGVDDSEPQTFSGVILFMAYQVGLNREPDKFMGLLQNPRMNNIRRKMWGHIRLWDIYYGCTGGDPLMVHANTYDTKLPYYEPGNENNSNIELDKLVTEYCTKCCVNVPLVMNVLKLVLNVNSKPLVRELCHALNILEINFYNDDVTLVNQLSPGGKIDLALYFSTTMQAKYYLFMRAFFMSVYSYLFLHYEQNDLNLAYFYLKKLMIIGCNDIMPHYNKLLKGTHGSADMIINPILQNLVNKCNQLNFSVIIRVNFKINQMQRLPEHFDQLKKNEAYANYHRALCRLSSYVTRCAEILIAGASRLSSRYYYAWRLAKSHTFLLKTITSVDFYNKYHSRPNLELPKFSLEQIEELSAICEIALCSSETGFNRYNGQIQVGLESEQFYGMCAKDGGASVAQTPSAQTDVQNGINFVDNIDIDQIWFQMLSKKYDKQQYDDFLPPEHVGRYESNAPIGHPEQRNNWFTQQTDDIEQLSKFDIFGDLPFDQVFK